MVIIDRWSLYRNTANKDHLIKLSLFTGFLKKPACQIWCENYLGWNQPFTKFVEAANNLKKLEVGKPFAKFVKFENNFTKFIEFANNYTKFAEFANNFTKFMGLQTTSLKFLEAVNNFTKFVGLVNNFWKVHKTCKNFKFVDWKVGFKCLEVFLDLSFTCVNILIEEHKCFVNTFHVSWTFFTNKLNSGFLYTSGQDR